MVTRARRGRLLGVYNGTTQLLVRDRVMIGQFARTNQSNTGFVQHPMKGILFHLTRECCVSSWPLDDC